MKTNLNEVNKLHQSDLYLYFYEDFIDDKRTEKECEFIIKSCGLVPTNKLLDLACGHGRHSLAFAERGLQIDGIDINDQFIEKARQEAKAKQLKINFYHDNILNITAQQQYDAIILLFNSFGFLDKKDANSLLSKMKQAIHPTGKIFLDIKNRDHIAKELSPFYVLEKGDDLMIDRLSFNPVDGTTKNDRIYIKDGLRYDAPFSMQLYNFSELEAMLSAHGLKITQHYGNWDGSPFDANSRRIILVINPSCGATS